MRTNDRLFPQPLLFGVVLVASAVVLSACSSGPRVKSDAAPGYDFTRLEHFAVVPPSSTENTTLGPSQMRLVAVAVEVELRMRGYEQAANAAAADFLVACHTQMDAKIDDTQLGYSTRHWQTVHTRSPGVVGGLLGTPARTDVVSWETGFDHDVQQYQESTVILDVVDAKSRELIWRGWARRSTHREQPTSDELKQAVARLLEKFPSRN